MRKVKLLTLLLLLILSSCGGSSSSSESSQESVRFDNFLHTEFIELVSSDAMTLNFTLKAPEAYGITRNATLENFSPNALLAGAQAERERYNKLRSFDRASLTAAQQREYDALSGLMSAQLDDEFLLYDNIINSYIASLHMILAEFNFYTKQDIDTYLLLLQDIPRAFDDVALYLQAQSAAGLFMPDYTVDEAIAWMEALVQMNPNILVTSFEQRLDELTYLSNAERQQYKTLNASAVNNYALPAYTELIALLQSLKGTGVNEYGTSNLPNGRRYYEQLVKQTGLQESIAEIDQSVDRAIARNSAAFNELREQYPDLNDRLSAFDYGEPDPQATLEYLEEVVKAYFPPLEGVNYSVKEVPSAIGEVTMTPAFYLVPPLDGETENVIYVNKTQLWSYKMYSTMAHEGYPGHLYQANYAKNKISPLRSVYDATGYVEGWASYVELLSYDWIYYKDSAPEVATYWQLNEPYMIFSAIKLDIGINYYGWTLEEAAIEMGASDTDAGMIESYKFISQNPCYYIKYFATYIKIEELKLKAQTALGARFNEKAFHKAILDVGPSHFDLVEKAIDTYIEVARK